jgi:hypothetical protein
MDTGFSDLDFLKPIGPLVFGPNCKEIPVARPEKPDVPVFPTDISMDIHREAPKVVEESICQEAHRLVNGERDQTYGTALTNFTRIAKLWSVVLNMEVTPEQVGLCMALLKIAREVNKHKRDNLVDCAGYLLCTQKVIDEKAAKSNG